MRQDLAHVVHTAISPSRPAIKDRWVPRPAMLGAVDWNIIENLDTTPRHIPMRPRLSKTRPRLFRYPTLKRVIQAQIGRPWSEVFGELVERFSGSNAWEAQVRIGRIVQTDCRLGADGSVQCTLGGHQWWPLRGMYVHPVTGLLCETATEPRYRELPRVVNQITGTSMDGAWARDNYRPIDATHYAAREDGIWYVYTVGIHADDDLIEMSWDYLKARNRYITYGDRPEAPRWYLKSKKQASRRRLRRLGVRNSLAA